MTSSLGYDTLHISLTREQVGENAFWGLADRLQNPWAPKHQGSTSETLSGQLSNLKVKRSPQMVKIQGSFAKYHHQNPYSLLSVDEVPEALSRLSDEVGFDLSHGSVKRLDIAMDLFTEYPPDYYIHAMMGRPNMERFEAPHSVTWVNKRRVSSAYDKIDEIIEKQGWEIPEKWVGKNVMRYEMRILQRVGRVFGHDVKAATLEDIGFFDHMVNYLIQDYKTIQLHPKNPFLMRAKTITEMQEEASAAYFQSLGPQGIEAYLNSHKYDRPEQKSRLRKRILELLQKYPGEGNFLPTL